IIWKGKRHEGTKAHRHEVESTLTNCDALRDAAQLPNAVRASVPSCLLSLYSLMCGRFSLSTPPEIVAKLFDLGLIPRLPPRSNISPTRDAAVVRAMAERDADKQPTGKSSRQLDLLHWGLIPHWADDKPIGNRMINAKVETAADKPAFRDAFKKR